MPAGVREVWLEFAPVADADDAEPNETIDLTVTAGAGYTLGTNTAATVTLANETVSGLPSARAAARFLIQAAFGPDGVKATDANGIAQNVAEVMQLGFLRLDRRPIRASGLQTRAIRKLGAGQFQSRGRQHQETNCLVESRHGREQNHA